MLRILLALFLLIPLPVMADHVPTQEPYGYNESVNTETGDLTISLLGSDGFEDSPPEKYTIFFGMATGIDDKSYCVSTSFGHEQNVWNDYVFSISDLRTYFELPVGTFYYRVRSDNDTDNSYSTISAERSIALPDQTPFNETQRDWSGPTTTCVDTSINTTTTTSSTTTTTTIPPTEEELNFAETGIYETNAERKAREEKEAEEARVNAAREWERDKNFQETGIRELDSERREREAAEKEAEETAIRDQQRKANEDKYGCYMTDAQIDRGDCEIPEEEPKEEVIIVVDEETKPDTKKELPDDDVVVPEVVVEDEVEKPEPIKEEDIPKEEVKIDVKELEEEFAIEEEVIELPEIIIVEEDVIEDELDKEIPGDDIIREDTVQEEDVKEQDIQEEIVEVISEDLSEEEIEEVVEEYVEQLETEEVIEILDEVVVEEITEEEVVVVQAVVEEAIDNVEELTEEQVEVVAEVLQVEKEDVEIIADAVKEDEVVAEAVEIFVQKAVENKDVEDYTLADVVTEIQFDNFIENPVEVLVDFEDIDLTTIGQDMTQDQKEKAQEVVVPVILTRIASMAAFVFRRSL